MKIALGIMGRSSRFCHILSSKFISNHLVSDLRRFPFSFSNDGGMDFLSSSGVYQVTSSPSAQKIQSDLGKLPGIPRVMVLSHCPSVIRELCMNSEIVTEIITSEI